MAQCLEHKEGLFWALTRNASIINSSYLFDSLNPPLKCKEDLGDIEKLWSNNFVIEKWHTDLHQLYNWQGPPEVLTLNHVEKKKYADTFPSTLFCYWAYSLHNAGARLHDYTMHLQFVDPSGLAF